MDYDRFSYSDGSGNTYIIDTTKMTIEYKPIQKQFSSSGIYSGGEHKIKTLNEEQINSLVLVIKNAIDNKEDHISNRVMLSGLIIIEKANKKEKYIIKPHSKEIQNIENSLNSIIN